LEQLKIGGCIVLPLDEGDNQRMHRLTKQLDGTILEEKFDEFSFVPMLIGKRG
jgi:protein-L-isoaspartate(D-aspartate) O-methyltransferase